MEKNIEKNKQKKENSRSGFFYRFFIFLANYGLMSLLACISAVALVLSLFLFL